MYRLIFLDDENVFFLSLWFDRDKLPNLATRSFPVDKEPTEKGYIPTEKCSLIDKYLVPVTFVVPVHPYRQPDRNIGKTVSLILQYFTNREISISSTLHCKL